MEQETKLFRILEHMKKQMTLQFFKNSDAVYSKWEVDEVPSGWNFLSGVDGIGILQEYQPEFLSENQPAFPLTHVLSYSKLSFEVTNICAHPDLFDEFFKDCFPTIWEEIGEFRIFGLISVTIALFVLLLPAKVAPQTNRHNYAMLHF